MQERWKTAALGGLIGAAMSLAVVFGLVALNVVPIASDARLHSYLMAHPKLAYEMQAMADVQEAEESAKQSQAAVDRLGPKKFFDPAVAYVTGPANAKNTFVEFFDYNCGHCRNTSPTVRKFYEKHKNDTRFAFIDFPIFGQDSTNAARTSVAARYQGDRFLALHFSLMAEGKTAIDQDILLQNAQKAGLDIMKLSADINQPEVDKALLASLRLAREAKFRGTPVFIVNGKVHEGEITEADLKALMKKG
jgi:protein-disulfide isomerase